MRNLFKLLFRRVVIVSLAIVLQLAFVVLCMARVQEYGRWVAIGMQLLSWVLVISLMFRRENPSYKMAWIVLILAFPVAGLTFYLMLGGQRLSKKERAALDQKRAFVSSLLTQEPKTLAELESREDSAFIHARATLCSSGCPVYRNTAVTYFPDAEPAWRAMLEDLERAQKSIFLEYFIVQEGRMWNAVLDILKRKAGQGVDVRFLYDDFGCITKLPMHYARDMAAFGIQARAFNPFVPVISKRLNNRDHRKLLIIDGRVGYTGGFNLADEYINETQPYGVWKDSGVRLEGDAVWTMTVLFLSMWEKETPDSGTARQLRPEVRTCSGGYVQPFADSPLDHEPTAAELYQNLIDCARKRVWIMSPYLIPDDRMTDCLCSAAKAGVDVRIITPGIPDKKIVYAVTRANYAALLQSGVRIFVFTPGFIHAKVCLSDDRYALVGTMNLDFRSLYLNYEDGVYLADDASLSDIEADFTQTFAGCREVSYQDCRQTRLPTRILQAVLRMFSPLM